MWKITTQRVRLAWSDAVDIQECAARGTCGALAVSSTENGEETEETEETEEEEEAWCCISSLYQPGEERWMEDEIDGLSEGRWWWCGWVREREGWRAPKRALSPSLSVPAHISSRRAGMRRGHSEPITKLIK